MSADTRKPDALATAPAERISSAATARCRQPNRHKMALLTYLNLLWLVHSIPPALQVAAPEHPLLAVSISVALIVGIMSYLILPLLRRFSGSWLYR